jgi:hypothetical protein
MTLSIKILSITKLCHYAKRRVLLIVMLSVIMLSVFMLSVIRLNVVWPSVMAPEKFSLLAVSVEEKTFNLNLLYVAFSSS